MADHYLDKNGLAYYDGVMKQRFEDVASQAGKSLYYIFGTEIPETYNEATFTATNDFTGDTFTGTIVKENLQIKIDTPGYYTVSNTADEKTWSILVGDFDSDEIDWEGEGSKRGIGTGGGSGSDIPGPSPSETINATITVTVPQELVGETIEAKLEDGTSFEQTAASTEVEIAVTKKGEYTVRVKGNDYIKTTTNVTESTSYYATLTVSDDSIPSITVTVSTELIGENIVVQGNTYRKTKQATTTTLKFYVNALENFTVSCQNYPSITQTVNVEEAKNYTANLKVDPASTPVLIVKVGQDLEGKQVTVKKDAYSYTKTTSNRSATFILPETGEWTISSTEVPEKDRKVNIAESKTYTFNFPAAVYTIKIKKDESDPTNRIEYMDDAIGMEPATAEGGTVNLGEWLDTFFFDGSFNYPAMLKTDGTIEYKLNPNDYSLKSDEDGGGYSDIGQTSYDGNAMSIFNKVYTRFWSDAQNEYISITNDKKSGYTALGFIGADGSEMDWVAMGMYLGSNVSSKLRSISGQSIMFPSSTQASTFDVKSLATKNGTQYGLGTWSLFQVLNACWKIVFKTDDCSKIAQGRKGAGESTSSLGTLPSLKTGVLSQSGPVGVDTSSGCVKFMHIEDFFSNRATPLAEMLDGLAINLSSTNNQGAIYVKASRPYADIPSNGKVTTSTYSSEGGFMTTTGNIKTSQLDNRYGRVPSTGGGTSSTYQCDSVTFDQYSVNFAGTYAGCRRGGTDGLGASWFYCHPHNYVFRGSCCARLSYEPPAAA